MQTDTQVTEGSTIILFPNKNEVFYNKVQVINRDISILIVKNFISLFKEEYEIKKSKKPDIPEFKIRMLEALSASGLRSIRYFKEVDGINEIVVNDIDPGSVENIKKNILHNNISFDNLIPSQKDAIDLMYSYRKKEHFHIIDLDPYGSSGMFLDAAVQCICNGGLLCITSTDLRSLCGKTPEICYNRYNSMPIPSTCYTHEMAYRILLSAIEQNAIKYSRFCYPLISIFNDFYVRVFVRIFDSPFQSQYSITRLSWFFQCSICDSFEILPIGKKKNKNKNNVTFGPNIGPSVGKNCEFCRCLHHLGGPIWSNPTCDKDFIRRCLNDLIKHEKTTLFASFNRIKGLLSIILEELDCCFFYDITALSHVIKCISPSMKIIISAILNSGYNASRTHVKPTAIKTDAPNAFIWKFFQYWVEKNPIKQNDLQSPGNFILNKEITDQNIDITPHPNVENILAKIPVFLPNPEQGWGPKTKHVPKRNLEYNNQENKKQK